MDWQTAFDDTAVFGLLITALYFVAFLLSIAVVFVDHAIFVNKRRVQSLFWWSIAAFMLLMSINKQLDLQTIFIGLGKSLFLALDLYDVRRDYQRLFSIGFVLVVALCLIFTFIKLLPVIKKHLLAMVGLLFLVIYIDVRMLAVNRLGQVFDPLGQGIPVERLFEFAGVLLIMMNAIILLRQKNHR